MPPASVNHVPGSSTVTINKVVPPVPTPISNNRSTNSNQSAVEQQPGPTMLQLAIAAVVLGSSAGFTLYTRKADAMLRGMEQIKKNQLLRNPPKFGPPTREEWEKLRPRFEKGDWF